MTQKDWFKQYDKIKFGLLVGFLSSTIGFLLNYFVNRYLFTSLIRYWKTYRDLDFEIVGEMMTLALLMPMAVFYFTFFRKDYQQFSRGILMVILPIVIFIVALSI